MREWCFAYFQWGSKKGPCGRGVVTRSGIRSSPSRSLPMHGTQTTAEEACRERTNAGAPGMRYERTVSQRKSAIRSSDPSWNLIAEAKIGTRSPRMFSHRLCMRDRTTTPRTSIAP